MAVQIPGLTLCPAEDDGEFLSWLSFKNVFRVPESQKYGFLTSIGDYQDCQDFLKGKFANIYRCTVKKTKKKVLLKDYEHIHFTDVINESNILHGFNSAKYKNVNIVQTYGIVAGETFDSMFLLMEDYECSLAHIINESKSGEIYNKSKHKTKIPSLCIDEKKIKKIMQKLLCGLEYIHDKKFMHRNLNPGCIFFDKNSELKIANFEHARMMRAGYVPSQVKAVKNYLATVPLSEENNTGIDICYLAPEILLLSEDHTTAVDIWSAGCIFAELLLKEKVFYGTKDIEVLIRIFYTLGMPDDEIWPGWSKLPGLDLYKIENFYKYNYIRKIFCQQSGKCIDLLNAMFLYYPKARNWIWNSNFSITSSSLLMKVYPECSAKQCLQLDYFKEEPRGPPLDLKEIFEALKTGIKRPSTKSSSSCYYSSTK